MFDPVNGGFFPGIFLNIPPYTPLQPSKWSPRGVCSRTPPRTAAAATGPETSAWRMFTGSTPRPGGRDGLFGTVFLRKITNIIMRALLLESQTPLGRDVKLETHHLTGYQNCNHQYEWGTVRY